MAFHWFWTALKRIPRWVYAVVVGVALMAASLGCSCPKYKPAPADSSSGWDRERESRAASCAEYRGWMVEYKRGMETLHNLAEARRQDRELAADAFRGEQVAFLGVTAPPGGSNDLVTWGGFYVRVVNPGNKDLRPHATCWEAILRGKILQVLVENKVVVVEVTEKDWVVLDTW